METLCGSYGNGGGSVETMHFYKVEYDGTNIVHDGETMTYADVVRIFNDNAYFLYAEAYGITMIPVLPPYQEEEIVEFTGTWIENGETTVSRLIINSDNEIKYENKMVITKDDIRYHRSIADGMSYWQTGNSVDVYGTLDLGSGTTIKLPTDVPYRPVNAYAILPLYSTTLPYNVVGTVWIGINGEVTVYKPTSAGKFYTYGSYCTNAIV